MFNIRMAEEFAFNASRICDFNSPELYNDHENDFFENGHENVQEIKEEVVPSISSNKINGLKINPKNNIKYPLTENLCQSNSLSRALSKEHLNKLAQPKYKFSSAEDLRKNDFVSMDEAINKFHKGTRTSKPSNLPCSLRSTVPQSPFLRTMTWHRDVMTLTSEQKIKIKAKPNNKKILGPMKAMASAIQKPVSTIPQPFNLAYVLPKKVQPSPKKEVPVPAKPAPKSLYQEPKTPAFMRRCNSLKSLNLVEEPKQTHPPRNDNFEERHKIVLKKEEALVNKNSNENMTQPFKARPPTVVYKIRAEERRREMEEDKLRKQTEYKAQPVKK